MERRAHPSASRAPAGCVDTLRLSEPQRAALEEELNRGASGNKGDRNLRASVRMPYNAEAGVHVLLYHPGGTAFRYLVRPRNISRGGIGFLHGAYVHHNSRCGLVLRDKDNRAVFMWGQVVRCRHVRGHIHEVGVQFEEPIDIHRFVDNCLRVESEQQHSVEMPRLSGRILYIDGSEDERELLRFHIEQLGLEVRLAGDGRAALEAADQNGIDLVLTELHLLTISGLETIELLRQQGHTGPIIALTSDPDTDLHDEALGKGADAVLTKPCNLDRLSQELARHLPPNADDAAPNDCLISEHWSNLKMRPLILAFLGRLGSQVELLRAHVEADGEHAEARRLCLELKSSASGYGYPTIGEAADKLCRQLDAGAGPDELNAAMERVEQLCEAARRLRSTQPSESGNAEGKAEQGPSPDRSGDAGRFNAPDDSAARKEA